MQVALGGILSTFDIKGRIHRAGYIISTSRTKVYHPFVSMLLAVRRSLVTLEVEVRLFSARVV